MSREKGTIELGGKTRRLAYDLNALCALEDHGGIDQTGSPKGLRAMLWAGLLHEEPDLSLDDVGRLVTLDRIEEIATAVGEAMSRDMPSPGQAKGAEPKARPRKAQRKA